MTNSITKKIAAAAIAVTTLAGSMAATTTAVVTTTAAVSALSATPAAAGLTCFTHNVKASGSSAGAVARFRKRRAERRAKSAWKKHVKHYYGSQYANFDRAKNKSVTFGVNARGNTKATVRGTVKVCNYVG